MIDRLPPTLFINYSAPIILLAAIAGKGSFAIFAVSQDRPISTYAKVGGKVRDKGLPLFRPSVDGTPGVRAIGPGRYT